MLHGGDAKHLPFDKNALAALPFSYIALGHIHKPAVLLENRMAYPGSPDLWTLRRPALTLSDRRDRRRHRPCDLSEIQAAAQAQYIPLVVSVTPATTNAELSQLIADEIKKRGASNIYRLPDPGHAGSGHGI